MEFFKKPIFIITLVFIIKLFSVLYLIHLSKCDNPEEFLGIACMSGDANSYITPIDNYLNEGEYYFESAKAGRMPYVGLVYLPLRLLFSKSIALSIFVLLQVLIGSIATYFTAKLCENLIENRKTFWLYIFLSSISLHVTIFDYYILSESFGISFICLFAYHYHKFLSYSRNNKQLLITGFFLALAILFKPFLSLLFLLIGVEFILYEYQNKGEKYLKNISKSVLFICFPLLILNAPWTIRNYIQFDKIIPFQQDISAGYNYSQATLAVASFIETIGESVVFWDKRSAGCYFIPKKEIPCEYQFPKRIFNSALTMNQIEEAKNLYLKYQKNPSDSLEKLTVFKFNRLSEIYKKEHPFFYYCITPIILTQKFLIHSGSYYLPIKKDSECYQPYQWIIKLSQSLMYYLTLVFGFIGIVFLFRKNLKSFIILTIPIYLIIIFPLYFQKTEWRYFHPAYPFLLIGLIYLYYFIRKKWCNR